MQVQTFYKKRDSFSHKGSFGHALIIAGSQDKMGACILSTKACLKAGAGLVTAHIPAVGKKALNIVVPEVMLSIDTNETTFTSLPATLTKFNAIGIGPGIGTYNETVAAFTSLLKLVSPTTHLLLDADALNILSENKALLHQLKPNTILTPHPKEFDRLFGNCNNDFDRIELAKQNASEYKIIIVLKGHHTFIATPTEKHWFNSTGNAGMATGGSGDVLTGMITGLLAQQYEPLQACLLGVYLHGLAGDLALKVESMESLIASDIIKHIGVAYHSL
jgi:NAD(P)H-hydrate epimerase